MSAVFTIPLSPLEKRARNHALLCGIGFLIFLPIGVLVARYTRTYTRTWFGVHWVMQFLISGPIIFAGVALGYMTGNDLDLEPFSDPHQRVGLTLLILYLVQLLLGAVVHFVKLPSVFHGHRAPHNYLHIAVGVTIFILAAYQVHYGLYTQWTVATGGLHLIPDSAKHAWLALIIVSFKT
ncbi:hypothetical protein AGABI1DRAFT_46873 [Agaricus bisporus var. burnettii JB137-S8]|uniref:Cytochrome b561 domain-containing protein n=1 Tax=Agaricus bisporus var. burnettii (strain JB137-S8 / ATCC MYA-4627 / FGSC 10392) TaxID=597362 RepID=K5WWI9_AGABU|nr:uncharacterized protein AGABI1DRAFT_46873 [Agaricus bisporus var. burnettii JB137-S8]EKM75163.1 hypothetical protein AGABI1DRAFT_46873 [Agaricus bisporus var. burnettii JB137-S8]